ncbi:MAG: flavin reductase family protein [Pyrodictiaceae archaeon]
MEASPLRPLGPREKFYYVLHPAPTIVLITKCPNNKYNAMPASWNMPVSEEPPTIAVSIYRETYTFKCLEHHPEATINIPHSGQADIVYALGTTSGENVDKISMFSLKLEDSETIGVPRWADAIASIEARVLNKMDVGETRIYVFEVLRTLVREDLYTKWGWDFSKTSILLHGAGRVFYTVGRKIFAGKLGRRQT